MLNVLKASGQKEPFSEEKLRASIQRVGIAPEYTNQVINTIKSRLYEGIFTRDIYKQIIDFLERSSQHINRARYGLKQAIMDLGPTGYPFEDYIAEILKMEGFNTFVRQVLQGKCINHEIDIVAEKNNLRTMIECKFHNSTGSKTQIHVALYTKARFDDVKEQNSLQEALLITNTKITSDVLNYALCSKIKVMSWDYPEKGSLRDLVEKHKLYPITSFVGLSQNQKQMLTENHIVLARDVCKTPSCLDILGLPKDKKSSLLSECQFLNR
jgi:hypothetical protein